MNGIRMFAGELDGTLAPHHISFRADAVRKSIGEMFRGKAIANGTELWREARKYGWKVVPVIVVDQRSWKNFQGGIPNKEAMATHDPLRLMARKT
jgi:hypothetical protein